MVTIYGVPHIDSAYLHAFVCLPLSRLTTLRIHNGDEALSSAAALDIQGLLRIPTLTALTIIGCAVWGVRVLRRDGVRVRMRPEPAAA